MTRCAKYLLAAMLIVVGVIHLIPVTGIRGVEQLNALCGISIDDRNLSIFIRHWAVLFGLLGMFLVYAASFLLLAYSTGGFNEALRREL